MILSNPFNQQEFTNFVKDFLPNFNLDVRKVEPGNSGFREVLRLGSSPDVRTEVLVVRSSKNINSRISLTNNSFKILKTYSIYRALVVYVNDDETIWRLSLLTATPTLSPDGKTVLTLSNPRRHSYVLGTEVGVATARKYLSTKGKVQDFADLEYRFSVEAVNKDFYSEIAEHFYKLVGKYGTKREVLQKPVLKLPDKKASIEDLQNYSVRLLGRLIFLWFLRQKASSDGNPLLPSELLYFEGKDSNKFLHNKVEPLFFEVLNKQVPVRIDKFKQGLYGQVPYLNGGLFHASEGLAGDYYNSQDQSSEVEIPDIWFKDLFNTLNTYNFTIDENLENDVDLSIDPEMLGRVFENLLAEINPETGQIARKSTGSYYTPRAIVNFMVDETLKEYLQSKTGIEEKKLDALLSISKIDDLEYPLTNKDRIEIVEAISELKVLDPACGSGAFPMGMLQKLLWIVAEIDPQGTEYLESSDMEGTEHWFSSSRLDYLRKRKIIRDIIFGTDIQSVAVEIAKLRCFLTLIVDQEIDDSSPNRGVVPLPNLEFKFICADSLTPLDENRQQGFGDDPELENKLTLIRKKYFTTTSEERKTKLRQDYEKLVNDQPQLEFGSFGESKRNKQLKSFRPLSSNNQAKFFDIHTMFGLDSFPIVIGNPPYKVLEGKDSAEILENLRAIKSYKYATDKGKLNLYRHFIERSQQLLSVDGVLSFIVPSTLIADVNTQGIRKMFRNTGALKFLIEFPEKEKVFESVTQATTVFLFKKGKVSETIRLAVGLNKATLPPESFATIKWKDVENLFGESLTLPLIKSEYEFTIMDAIYSKSVPLAKVIKCYRGDINLGTYKTSVRSVPTKTILVRGEHIREYEVDLSTQNQDRRWFESKESFRGSSVERVVSQHIANMGLRKRLVAGIVPENVIVGDSANCFEPIDPNYTLKVIVGLLNSNLLNWYYKRLSTNNNVNIYEMDILPIPSVDKKTSSEIETLIDQIMKAKKSNDDSSFEKVSRRLNELVYNLYQIDEKSIELIESELNSPSIG